MLLNAHPLAVRVESADAAVAVVFCGGIVVVGIFAFAGAMIGALIELWRRRPTERTRPAPCGCCWGKRALK
jgi:hypothetical protein